MPTRQSSDASPKPLFACLRSQQVLDHVAPFLEPEAVLSPLERDRAEALARQDDRRDFVAARLLTRLLLRQWHGPGTELASIGEFVLTQSCDRCGKAHGRPTAVSGVAVSWSHAGGFVAAAVGRTAVGVDVEPRAPAGIGRPSEPVALRAWVRGEAILKWGHGSLDDVLAWQPLLGGRVAPRGRGYVLDDDGRPHPRRKSGTPHLVVTDAPTRSDEWMCAVAADRAALWVDPLE